MSGGYRRLLGPAKARLLKYLGDIDEETSSSRVSNEAEDLEEKKSTLSYFLDRLNKTVELIDKTNDKWTHFLTQLKGDDLSAEEELYSGVFEGENGLFQVIFDAKEKISRLELLIKISAPQARSFTPDPTGETAVKELHPPRTASDEVSRSPTESLAPQSGSQSPTNGEIPAKSSAPQFQEFVPMGGPQQIPSVAPELHFRDPYSSGNPFVQRFSTPMGTSQFPPSAARGMGPQVQYQNLYSPNFAPHNPAFAAPGIRVKEQPLPDYYGDVLKWRGWWQTFFYHVHSQPIPPIQKFSCLKALLKGKALAVIDSLDVSDETYPEAIRKLHFHFADEKVMGDVLYDQFRKLSFNSPKPLDVRSGTEQGDMILARLSAIGENIEQRTIRYELLKKLHQPTFKELQRLSDKSDEDWTVKDIQELLWKYVKQNERAQRLSHSPTRVVQGGNPAPQGNTRFGGQGNRGHQTHNPPSRPQGTMDSFVTVNARPYGSKEVGYNEKQRTTPKTSCIFCEKFNHFYDDCYTVSTIQARQRRLEQLNRCIKCLKIGHGAPKCPGPKRACFHCKSTFHSRVLCPQHINKINSQKAQFQTRKGYYGSTTAKTANSKSQIYYSNSHSADSLQQDKNTDTNEHMEKHCIQEQPVQGCDDQSPVVGKNNYFNSTTVCLNPDCTSCQQFHTATMSKGNSMLLTATVYIRNPENHKLTKARLFLDSGSQGSFITTKLSKKTELPVIENEILSVHTFGAEKPQQMSSELVNFEIICQDGTPLFVYANALSYLTSNLHRDAISSEDLQFLQGTPVNQYADPLPLQQEAFQPDILLGLDYVLDVIDTRRKRKMPSGLYLVPSKFGLLIGGKNFYSFCKQDTAVNAVSVQTSVNQSVDELNFHSSPDTPLNKVPNVQDYWSLETIGIQDQDDDQSKTDEEVRLQFRNQIQFKDNRYHVVWPWKTPERNILPDNKALVLARFKSLLRRLVTDRDLLLKIDAVVVDQENQTIVEEVDDEITTSNLIHYLAHFPVLSPGKTTKVRIVYDGGLKSILEQLSLNDCLHRGPVLLKDLCGLLLRFRLHPIGIISEIAKAFLQIYLQESERDVTRFFWIKDINKPLLDPSNWKVLRFTRVIFGAKPSPFILSETVNYHMETVGTPVATQIKNDNYVDNVITGVGSVEEGKRFYQESKAIFNQASMNLREFVSNSEPLMNFIDESDKVTSESVKVLGLKWHLDNDSFSAPITHENIGSELNKREVLRAVASVFDPLGFFGPVTVAAKLFLQKLWKRKIDWDTLLSDELRQEWMQLSFNLCHISGFQVPRLIGSRIKREIQSYMLLCFSDSSAVAFTANVYLCIQYATKQNSVDLLMSKTRLVPIKGSTIPRLELVAVVVGTRLLKYVRTELQLPIVEEILWTDSSCVLDWIKSTDKLPVFVNNRLKEIRQKSDATFRFIPGHLNPADLATRPCTFEEFSKSKSWWHGPKFLEQPKEEWPTFGVQKLQPAQYKSIKTAAEPPLCQLSLAVVKDATYNENKVVLPDIRRFSNVNRLYRATVYMLRIFLVLIWSKLSTSTTKKHSFLCRVFSNIRDMNSLRDCVTVTINTIEIQSAKLYWCREPCSRENIDW